MFNRLNNNQSGFTLLEVLIAILVFVVSALVFIDLTRGASRTTRDTTEISTATWLLQNTMAELETKLETEGFEKGCDKKKEGKFAAPHDKFTWVSYCTEIDFKLSQTAAQMAQDKEGGSDEEPKKEDQLIKIILENASKYITKSMREIHVEVRWSSGKKKRSIDATTHIARYDQAAQLPAMTLGGG